VLHLDEHQNWSSRPLKDRRWATELEQKIPDFLGIQRLLSLTNSCTSAIEVAVGVLGVGQGDEWLIPSYTFGTVPGVFARRGAKIKWVDSGMNTPSAELANYQAVKSQNTKGVVLMPYGGFAAGTYEVAQWAKSHGLHVIEDAAHGFGGFEGGRPFGTIGDFSSFSFHDTKNLSCGEGGAVVYEERMRSLVDAWLDKGTDKQRFIDGEVEHYQWQVPAGALAMSELHACLLHSQWEGFAQRQSQRKNRWVQWHQWAEKGERMGLWRRAPDSEGHPAHVFYLKLEEECQPRLTEAAKAVGLALIRHFYPLHLTQLGQSLDLAHCPNAEEWDKRLIRIDFNKVPVDVGMQWLKRI
jgi:dTDP-4-amino-4,6-dideoxygalactose transaminase